ncbi:MAG: hypothetical protein R6X10_11040 [Desulfobacterales bacterium]
MTENEIGTIVIEAAITVHRELGRGSLRRFMKSSLPGNFRIGG